MSEPTNAPSPRTAATWWARTRHDEARLTVWLFDQYRGEVTAAERIERLRDLHATPGSRAYRVLTVIAGFMVRYLVVVRDELHRLDVARVSRADDPRWFWQARSVAATLGSMFVRTYERGERVQLAMVSRGFDGRFPDVGVTRQDRWWPAVLWPIVAVAIAGLALVST